MSSDDAGLVGGLLRTLTDAAPATVLLVSIGGLHDLRHRIGWAATDGMLSEMSDRVRACAAADDLVIQPEAGTVLVVRPSPVDVDETLGSDAGELVAAIVAADGTPTTLLRSQLGVAVGALGAGDDPLELLADLAGATDDARSRHDHVHVLHADDRASRTEARQYRRDLPEAIADDQLRLWYQPKIDLHTARVVGFEALARWPDDVGRMRSPAVFVPLLEESEAIVPFGRWAIERAVDDLAAWDRAGASPEMQVSVNLSARQLALDDVAAVVARATANAAIDPARLTLELTETAVLDDLIGASTHLGALRDAGAMVSLDDFGTGFSSLSLLRRLPFDEVKIDRSFMSELGRRRGETALVEGIVSLAHRIGRRIVAEGVESVEQLSLLLEYGCDQAQGFLFSRPVPPEEAAATAAAPDAFDASVAAHLDDARRER
ncbi:MAG: EAL domain-containing protein [Actinomycetota bacterium]